MKLLRAIVDAVFAIAACVLVVTSIVALTVHVWHWDSAGVAAWVQAIGAIGAVGVAIYVSSAQARNDRARELARDHAERLRILEGPMGIMGAVLQYMEQTPTAASSDERVQRFLENPNWGRGFMRSQTALRAIPLHEIPWWNISECVLEMMVYADTCQGTWNALNNEYAQRNNMGARPWRNNLPAIEQSIKDARATMKRAKEEAERIRTRDM